MQWGGLNNPSAMVEAKDFSGILVSTGSGLRKLGFDGVVTALNAQTDLGYLHYAPDGTLFSTSYGNSMVYQISETWQVSAYLPSGTISMPSSFTFNDDGELIISSNATRSIYRVKKDKSVQQVLSVASAGMSGNPNMVMRYYGQGWLVSTSTAMYILNDQWELQSKLVDNYADNLVTLNDGTMIFVKGNTSGIFQLIGAPAGSTLPPVNQPPSATLINPANGQQFTSPANLTLNATATDSDGTVAQVAFFNGTTLLGTVTQAPYTITIPNLAAGSYSIKAVATDNLGVTGSSNLASIVVDSPPVVTLVASPNTATAPAVLALTANASDTDGSIAKVEFFNGATSLGVANQAPFSFNWTNVAAGTYTLTVKATDNLGFATTSSAVTVVVNASSGSGTGGPEQVYYIQADHLNTPRIVTDKDNGVVWQWGQDDPFGSTVANQDPTNSGNPLEFNLRFPGQYFDKETNTHYNYFRDYDPQTGRYIQSDPIGLYGGINTYGYVGGNPISYMDPDGLLFMSTVGGLQRGTTLDQAATYGAAGNAAATVGGIVAGAGAVGVGVGAGAAEGTIVLTDWYKVGRSFYQIYKELNRLVHPELAKEPNYTPPSMTRPALKQQINEGKELADALRRDAEKAFCPAPK